MYKRKNDIQKLQDWYTTAIEPLSVRWACVLCQRINCWWNTKLHKYFSTIALVFPFITVIILGLVGIWSQKPMDTFVLTMVAPALPFFDLCLRLRRDHKECADEYEDLRESIRKLWEATLKKEKSDEALSLESRMLQHQIFQRRYKNPLVFNWLYWLFRKRQQLQMDYNAEEMVSRALQGIAHTR